MDSHTTFRENKAERRRAMRHIVHWQALVGMGTQKVRCAIVDISASGAKIYLDMPLRENDRVSLIVDQFGKARGNVVWVDQPFYGVEFSRKIVTSPLEVSVTHRRRPWYKFYKSSEFWKISEIGVGIFMLILVLQQTTYIQHQVRLQSQMMIRNDSQFINGLLLEHQRLQSILVEVATEQHNAMMQDEVFDNQEHYERSQAEIDADSQTNGASGRKSNAFSAIEKNILAFIILHDLEQQYMFKQNRMLNEHNENWCSKVRLINKMIQLGFVKNVLNNDDQMHGFAREFVQYARGLIKDNSSDPCLLTVASTR